MKKAYLISLLLTLNGFANDEVLTKSQEVNNALAQNTYEPNYFSMILGLFVVVVLIYATGYLYQKLLKVKLTSSEDIVIKPQVLSTTSIGQGRNLHVVKIGNSACLIGSTQNNITFLKDINIKSIGEKEGVLDDEKC